MKELKELPKKINGIITADAAKLLSETEKVNLTEEGLGSMVKFGQVAPAPCTVQGEMRWQDDDIERAKQSIAMRRKDKDEKVEPVKKTAKKNQEA